jgi:hypothetical protein
MIVLSPRKGIPHIFNCPTDSSWYTYCNKMLPRSYSTITIAVDDKYPEICQTCWTNYNRISPMGSDIDPRRIRNYQDNLSWELSHRSFIGTTHSLYMSLAYQSWRKLTRFKKTFSKRPRNEP